MMYLKSWKKERIESYFKLLKDLFILDALVDLLCYCDYCMCVYKYMCVRETRQPAHTEGRGPSHGII